jgi:predicted phosphodiesterase
MATCRRWRQCSPISSDGTSIRSSTSAIASPAPSGHAKLCDLVMARDDLTIRGNHDRWVSGPDPTSMGTSDRYAYSQLNQDHRSWLAALPTFADADHGILACHGTPTNDNQYLIEDASEGRLVRASLATIRERLGDSQARVVLCGHSHQQHLIQLPDGPVILNPGSVGCPSYDDPGNDPHVSEAGSPMRDTLSSTSTRNMCPPT